MKNYTYEEFKRDIMHGHEFEFEYGAERYSVSQNSDGWYITRFRDVHEQFFHNQIELLENGRIEEKPIWEIWGKIKNLDIF